MLKQPLHDTINLHSTGFYQHAQAAIQTIAQSQDSHFLDSLTNANLQWITLKNRLAQQGQEQDAEREEPKPPTDEPSEKSSEDLLRHAYRLHSVTTATHHRQNSLAILTTALARDQLEPPVKAWIAFTLGRLTPTGDIPEDSRSMGDVNSYISTILSSRSIEHKVLELILLLAIDRFDLAVQTYNQAIDGTDETVLTHLCHVWLALSRGHADETLLAVEDAESMMFGSAATGEKSWLIEYLKGTGYLAGKTKLKEALNHLEYAAAMTDFKQFAPLCNLIAVYRALQKTAEADQLTEKLLALCHESHPYVRALERLEEAAREYDVRCPVVP